MRRLLVPWFAGVVVVSVVACSEPAPVECKTATECNLHPQGTCLPAPTGKHWCAYEGSYAEGCAPGGRWSLEAGDGLAGQCVNAAPGADAGVDAASDVDAGPPHSLSVTLTGGGAGLVSSMPDGINCGTDCSESYDANAVVKLTAAGQAGATFVGWGDACAALRAAPTCDLAMNADRVVTARFEAPGTIVDSRAIIGPDDEAVIDVAVDAAGNKYVIGRFKTQVTIGGSTLLGYGGIDMFVAKIAPSGTITWAKAFGSNGDDDPEAIGVDATGQVWIAGAFVGSINFGGGTLSSVGDQDAFLATLAGADGAHVRSRRFGSAGIQAVFDLAVGPAGEIVLVGTYANTIDFGGGALTQIGASADAFVVKLDNGAVFQWNLRYGQGSYDDADAVVIDGSGNIFFGGRFEGDIDLGGGVRQSLGYVDAIAAKFTPDGKHVWSRAMGGPESDAVFDLALASNGDVLASGMFAAGVDFGGGTLTAGGVSDAFVTRLSGTTGGHVWAKQLGGSGADRPTGLVADAAGGFAVVGFFEASASFEGTILGSAGLRDAFVARLDPAGAVAWAKRFGGTLHDEGQAIAWDGQSGFVVGGSFAGTATFGTDMFTSAGGTDGFLIMLAR